MPTAKTGFHILNLHLKKYVFKRNFFKCQFIRKIPNILIINQDRIKKKYLIRQLKRN